MKNHLYRQLCRALFARLHVRDRLAAPKALALIGKLQARGKTSQGGFAAARLAHQPDHFALRDAQIDLVHGMNHFFANIYAEKISQFFGGIQVFDETARNAVKLQQGGYGHGVAAVGVSVAASIIVVSSQG